MLEKKEAISLIEEEKENGNLINILRISKGDSGSNVLTEKRRG